jgi:hypothetical protein
MLSVLLLMAFSTLLLPLVHFRSSSESLLCTLNFFSHWPKIRRLVVSRLKICIPIFSLSSIVYAVYSIIIVFSNKALAPINLHQKTRVLPIYHFRRVLGTIDHPFRRLLVGIDLHFRRVLAAATS